jgi:hypothetical protein
MCWQSFFFARRYSPRWALAPLTTSLLWNLAGGKAQLWDIRPFCNNICSGTPECPEGHNVKIRLPLIIQHLSACLRQMAMSSRQLMTPQIVFKCTTTASFQILTYPRLVVRFLNNILFYGMRLSAPCPTPNQEAQGVSLSLDSTVWPFRHGWPYQ